MIQKNLIMRFRGFRIDDRFTLCNGTIKGRLQKTVHTHCKVPLCRFIFNVRLFEKKKKYIIEGRVAQKVFLRELFLQKMSRSALERSESMNAYRASQQALISAPEKVILPIVQPLSQSTYAYGSYYPQQLSTDLFSNPLADPNQIQYPTYQNALPVVPIPHTYVQVPIRTEEEENDGDEEHKKNVLPIHGNTTTFNINGLLFNNIMESDYFKALYQLRTYHEVIDEVYNSVRHLEPWQTGTKRLPSTAFCLLLKFMLMKLTVKQMKGLLDTGDSSYVRAIGLLYLRYTCPPKDLYSWYEPYLEDEEEFQPSSDPEVKYTIGKYCIKLLTEMQYFGTMLPRIPVPIERKIKLLLLLLEETKKRRNENLRHRDLFRTGTKVQAIYQDEENEPQWYDAVIDSIDEEARYKYWVTFPEYGNSSCVDLGDMKLKDEVIPTEATKGGTEKTRSTRSRSRSRSDSRDRRGGRRGRNRNSRSRSRSRSRDRDGRGSGRHGGRDRDRDYRDRDRDRDGERDRDGNPTERSNGLTLDPKDLMAQVLESSRAGSVASGKDYAQRPASYKSSLSLPLDRYTNRKDDGTLKDRRDGGGSRGGGGRDSRREASKRTRSPSKSPPRQTQADINAALERQANLRKITQKYGDVSAGSMSGK